MYANLLGPTDGLSPAVTRPSADKHQDKQLFDEKHLLGKWKSLCSDSERCLDHKVTDGHTEPIDLSFLSLNHPCRVRSLTHGLQEWTTGVIQSTTKSYLDGISVDCVNVRLEGSIQPFYPRWGEVWLNGKEAPIIRDPELWLKDFVLKRIVYAPLLTSVIYNSKYLRIATWLIHWPAFLVPWAVSTSPYAVHTFADAHKHAMEPENVKEQLEHESTEAFNTPLYSDQMTPPDFSLKPLRTGTSDLRGLASSLASIDYSTLVYTEGMIGRLGSLI